MRTSQDAVEVKFWEIYLLRNRSNLSETLRKYALEGHGLSSAKDSDRIVFRFMKYDWDRILVTLLGQQSVPYEILRAFKTDVLLGAPKKKVYVAEDDLNILFSLNVMLEEAGYDVLLSHCGNRMMEKHLPATDLFILDNRMPDVNGIEVCRHLKSQPSTQHIPVIMISAYRNFKTQAVKAGADEFIEKPFQMKELLSLISRYTQSSRQLVE
jgi:CheY-like chemotaxis protein